MLSKSDIKLIRSLKDKKHRRATGLFVVESNKSVHEVLSSKIEVKSLFATRVWTETHGKIVDKDIAMKVISESEMNSISMLKTRGDVLALAVLPEVATSLPSPLKKFIIALDCIQDPGNLGTIMRIADWYGISTILYSSNTADPFQPKVIQASMGSFTRVKMIECDLNKYLSSWKDVSVFGAVLNGKNLYKVKFGSTGILLIGNEGSGISDILLSAVNIPVSIPGSGSAESLNAAIATGIICDARNREMSG